MRVRVLKTLVVIVVLVGLVVGFFVYVPYGPGAETFVDILPGTGTLGIARQLQKTGIVRSALAFDGAGDLEDGEGARCGVVEGWGVSVRPCGEDGGGI